LAQLAGKTERRVARKGSVLIVDDEEIMREVLETLLSNEGYRVDLAKTGEEGLESYGRRAYDVVLLDVSMPGIGGLRALEEFLKMDSDAVIVMITAYATFDTAIAAWEHGAFGCIRKPFQNEQITMTVAAGIKRRRKEEERQTLRRAMSRAVDRGAIVGHSDIMQEVFRLVEQVAPARSTVLITGESGTGKELIAKAIHEASPRAGRPFVTVNSSNIPSELLESELFGHTRGAFTGAVAAKKGLFEVADGGSIFLDEIGDIPPETQVRLLRVIQEREFTPLGDTTPRRVDVRIIAATNIELKEAVRERFAKTCTTASRLYRLNCRRSAIGAKTSCRWPNTSSKSITKKTAAKCRSKSRRRCWRCSKPTRGRVMSVNLKTRLSAPWSLRQTMKFRGSVCGRRLAIRNRSRALLKKARAWARCKTWAVGLTSTIRCAASRSI